MEQFIPELSWWHWLFIQLIAGVIAISKAGIPGLGILAVPLMAQVFEARSSVGMLLPMLIVADCAAAASTDGTLIGD